jgi:hypothetical protein
VATRHEQDEIVARELVAAAQELADGEIIMARFLTWERRRAVSAILDQYGAAGADLRHIRMAVYH